MSLSRVTAMTFLNTIIMPACKAIGHWSDEYWQLGLGTAMKESALCQRRQIGGGPALGLFQMEPVTYWDLVAYMSNRRSLYHNVLALSGKSDGFPGPEEMVANDKFAAAMCRVKYLTIKEPLPEVNDTIAQAVYWGKWYNTRNDPAMIAQYIDLWNRTMKGAA